MARTTCRRDKWKTWPICSSKGSVVSIPSATFRQTIGSTIRNTIKTTTRLCDIQTSARMIKEATGCPMG